MAHEISHVTQHHIARSISAQKDAMLMTLAALRRKGSLRIFIGAQPLASIAARTRSSSNAPLRSSPARIFNSVDFPEPASPPTQTVVPTRASSSGHRY